jgi:hypothetical protein
MKRMSILFLITAMVLTLTLVSVTSSIGQPKKQLAFALDTLCPPGHECHCTPASGVYHDYDPSTGQTFNINNGCINDDGTS